MNWSIRHKKSRACRRFEPSLWRPNVCRRCFCSKNLHKCDSDIASSSPGAEDETAYDTADSEVKPFTVDHSSNTDQTGHISETTGGERPEESGHVDKQKAEREFHTFGETTSALSGSMTSETRHVGRAEVKGARDQHFSVSQVVVVKLNDSRSASLASNTSNNDRHTNVSDCASSAKQAEAHNGTDMIDGVFVPVASGSPSSEEHFQAVANGNGDTKHDRQPSGVSSDSGSAPLSQSGEEDTHYINHLLTRSASHGKADLSTGSGDGHNHHGSEESVTIASIKSHHTGQLKTRHTEGALVLPSQSNESDVSEVEDGRPRSRSHDPVELANMLDNTRLSVKPVTASMSTEALNTARSPPPPHLPSSKGAVSHSQSTDSIKANMDSLLSHLHALPSSKRSPSSRFAKAHKYSPHQQYRVHVPRHQSDSRRKAGSPSDQPDGFVRGRHSWSDRPQSSTKSEDSPLLKRRDMSIKSSRSSYRHEERSDNDAHSHSQKRNGSPKEGRFSPQKAQDSSAMKFLVSQLEHIATWWQDADSQADDLRPMSLADYRLVEDMAADWCDGTAATPLWQANDSVPGKVTRKGEATLPVVCIRPGLKQPGRIYGLRVRVSNSEDDLDASSNARFKTDYRVLERIRPHPNVLRVLAHFRDVVPAPVDTGAGPGLPAATFVITNHLPLLNCKQYIPKCKEMLSKEGYERCIALLLYQLFDGLCHLHNEGAIHCNITLDNLLVVPTAHPGGGDRLVISSFGDSIYYMSPPKQFTLLAEQAAGMLDSGKGWKLRCQPPELAVVQADVAQGRTDHLIDLRHCDMYRAGQLLFQMLGLEEEISAYVSEADSFVKAAGKATAIYDSDISLPQVPITSCFSKPLTLLAACLMSKDPNERLEPREALEMVGCILWGPTMSHGSLGLDRGVTADGWLRKRQLEVLVGFAGAYACPAGGQQAGGFALADELQCRFLVSSTSSSIGGSLKRLSLE